MTALHLACAFAREDTIRMLLVNKADPMIPGGVSLFKLSNRFLKGLFEPGEKAIADSCLGTKTNGCCDSTPSTHFEVFPK